MKWKNKKHEFDDYIKGVLENKDISKKFIF